jgi:hypothetical protein
MRNEGAPRTDAELQLYIAVFEARAGAVNDMRGCLEAAREAVKLAREDLEAVERGQ